MFRSTVRSLLCLASLASLTATATEGDWGIGAYVGKYYDSEPAGFLEGRGNFVEQQLLALTASKTVWRAKDWPVSLELDGMIGLQGGVAQLGEVAIAPALRWSGFPWSGAVPTSVRIAPLGTSYTSAVSPLERGKDGKGSHVLNWLFLELAVSPTGSTSNELFVRLHHRCAIYDTLNTYGANGEDFFSIGFRKRF